MLTAPIKIPDVLPEIDLTKKVTDEADYLISGSGRRGTVRMIKSGEVSEVGARQ